MSGKFKPKPKEYYDNLMERTRAAVVYSNTHNSEASALNAFMALFHPDYDKEKLVQMTIEVRQRQRR